MVYDMSHLFFFMEKSMCWQLRNLSACFSPVELWESPSLFSFYPLSFLVQVHSVSAGIKFSRTLWVSRICHKNSLYSIRGSSIDLSQIIPSILGFHWDSWGTKSLSFWKTLWLDWGDLWVTLSSKNLLCDWILWPFRCFWASSKSLSSHKLSFLFFSRAHFADSESLDFHVLSNLHRLRVS